MGEGDDAENPVFEVCEELNIAIKEPLAPESNPQILCCPIPQILATWSYLTEHTNESLRHTGHISGAQPPHAASSYHPVQHRSRNSAPPQNTLAGTASTLASGVSLITSTAKKISPLLPFSLLFSFWLRLSWFRNKLLQTTFSDKVPSSFRCHPGITPDHFHGPEKRTGSLYSRWLNPT